ncbi:tyrosine-type recombinase/integrase [Methylovulum miyakonense]|uniref:tyrosine-type recombinase/integrase n=1 Tax=Methylovulum miyakonense TaxID=645578 RepID=UPI00036C0721|nr:tyrosine-type recombinase/integrase [Methylovulum miyakonense]
MSKPTKIKNKDGKTVYRIFVNRTVDGVPVRESRRFSTRQLAIDWADKRKREIERSEIYGDESVETIAAIIERYQAQFAHGFGRTKNYDIARLLKYDIAKLQVKKLTAKAIIAHCIERNKKAKPQTVANDVIWLRTIIRTMSHVEGFDFDMGIFDKASTVLQSEKLVGKSKRRNRRPTKKELWQLSRYFGKNKRSRVPMLHLMWFAVYSCRRVSEITRLEWADNDDDKQTGMVRDAKDPRKKEGNHRRFKYTASAWKIVLRQPKEGNLIFPYNSKTISTLFARACHILEINGLDFHDLRHEGASRLFEAGYRIEQVQMFTLHESWETLRRYTHLRPEDL